MNRSQFDAHVAAQPSRPTIRLKSAQLRQILKVRDAYKPVWNQPIFIDRRV